MKYAIAAAAMVISAPAMAADWRLASYSEDGSDRWYYDASDITRRDGFTFIFVRQDKPNGQQSFAKMRIDCSDYSYRFDASAYGENKVDTRPSAWAFANPGTNAFHIIREVC